MQFIGSLPPNANNLAKVIGGNEETLRQFIAAHFGRSFQPTTEETIVTIAQLPDDSVLSSLPLPDNLTVIGTVQRPVNKHAELIFVTEDAADDFLEKISSQWIAAGWQQMEQLSFGHGGFAAIPGNQKRFCHDAQSLQMSVTLYSNGLGNLDIHEKRNPCVDPHQMHMSMMITLPSLQIPEGIPLKIRQEGGGSSSNHAHTSATINTKANFADIDAHYRQQLTNAGWQLKQQHRDDNLALSIWDVAYNDENWHGTLMIIPIIGTDEIQLRLEMQAPFL